VFRGGRHRHPGTDTKEPDMRTQTRTDPQLDYLGGLQVRAATGLQLEVTAVRYDTWYPLAGTSEEKFVAHCFGDLRARSIPLLVSHDHASLPVGRAISWDDSATHLRGRFQLLDSARGAEVYNMVRDGYVSACSVGFNQPLSGRTIETRGAGLMITRHSAVLREISLVGVGQIADAVVSAVPAGVVEQPSTARPAKAVALMPATRSRPPTPQRDSWSQTG
jgi:HK97 family phage prohead protease